MYNLKLVLWFVLLLLISCDSEKQVHTDMELTPIMNLLDNGDCEEWGSDFVDAENYLVGWSMREHYGSITQEADKVYEGKRAVRMSSPKPGITASISQKIGISPGHNLRIRFHYYIERACTGTRPRMYCYFHQIGLGNISNSVLSEFYDEATWGIIRGGGYGLSSFPLEYEEWKLFDYIIQAPDIADYFVFEIHSYAGTTMYVDDCWVMDVDMYN